MAKTTVAEAITQIARNMSLVAGTNMTPYSPETAMAMLDLTHQMIRDEQEWHDFNGTFNRVLDGVTGTITEGITTVSDPKDINRIYHESSMTPLPKVSLYNNKLISTTLIGFDFLSRAEDPGPAYKLVVFYPIILTGNVRIEADLSFDMYNPATVIPVDWWLHVLGASWQWAMDDGTNPAQITKYETLYNMRLKQVKGKENNQPISLDPYAAIPDIWFEGDDPYWISSQ